MSTSILDYTFRELAISYLDRSDLGHVNVDDLDVTTTGSGETQSDMVNKVTSRGYIRKQGLVVYYNDGSAAVAKSYDTEAATKLTKNESAVITAAGTAAEVVGAVADQTAERVKQARMQGYEGEACPECQNFTLVRNGTCLKCNTCGGTTGCS